jgi:calcium-dependent protein kinase
MKLKSLAVTYIATQLPEKDIHHLGLLFSQIDTNSDGYLTIEELQAALEKQHENTSYAELKSIIEHIDTDRNGKINYNEFLASCLEGSLLQNEEYVSYVFKGLDIDHSGKISKSEIKQIYESAGIKTLNNADLDQIIENCDKNNDG